MLSGAFPLPCRSRSYYNYGTFWVEVTLLHIVGCLDRPTAGQLFIERQDVRKRAAMSSQSATGIGFVFQTFNLLAKATARKRGAASIYAGVRRREGENGPWRC